MKTGFVAGAFDLLHPGHIVLLRDCKELCDYLIVALHVNPQVERPNKNRPVQTVLERIIQLKGCKYVDDVIVYETESDLNNLLVTTKADARFLGDDYLIEDKKITGKDLVPIEYVPRNHSWSSTELRERIRG